MKKGSPLYIPILLGTTRKGRQSEKVAEFMRKEAKKRKVETTLIDPRRLELPLIYDFEHPNVDGFSATIDKADGFIIVSPEYNHGYPGALKNMMDYLYQEFHKKAVGICGVSNGGMGGSAHGRTVASGMR